jgi:hypothetical protein
VAQQRKKATPSVRSAGRSETITHAGRTVCIIVRTQAAPRETTFYTPDDFELQVGRIVRGAGTGIARHRHPPTVRSSGSAAEVLLVQEGRMIVDVYSEDGDLLCSPEVGPGDLIVLASGGHGFRFLEHTVLLEVKQGPYRGAQDKELF